jgi:hypothetical protein
MEIGPNHAVITITANSIRPTSDNHATFASRNSLVRIIAVASIVPPDRRELDHFGPVLDDRQLGVIGYGVKLRVRLIAVQEDRDYGFDIPVLLQGPKGGLGAHAHVLVYIDEDRFRADVDYGVERGREGEVRDKNLITSTNASGKKSKMQSSSTRRACNAMELMAMAQSNHPLKARNILAMIADPP